MKKRKTFSFYYVSVIVYENLMLKSNPNVYEYSICFRNTSQNQITNRI